MARKKKEESAGKPSMAPESKDCGPIIRQGYVVGHVDDVNGEGAQLVNWQPTRAELVVLGRHYLEKYYMGRIDFALTGESGSSEWRESVFSQQRLKSIEDALGPDTVIPEWDAYIEEQETFLSEIESGAIMASRPST